MKNGDHAWSSNWRQYISDAIDMLIGAFAFIVVYATIDGAADFLELLIAAVIAVVGIGFLLLEPDAAPPARDMRR